MGVAVEVINLVFTYSLVRFAAGVVVSVGLLLVVSAVSTAISRLRSYFGKS